MIKKILIALVLILLVAPQAFATPLPYTFTLSGPTITPDTALGFEGWYVWKYRVDVVTGGTTHFGLSNWVLELPDCYIASPNLFHEIEASAGAGDGDKVRTYIADTTIDDPNAHLSGLKWEHPDGYTGDQLDEINEFGYFWFSAPTDQSIERDWAIKAGSVNNGGGIVASGQIAVPDCPDCENPGVPEPISLLLFGSGLFGAGLLKKRENTHA